MVVREIDRIANKQEKEVARALSRMGFEFVAANATVSWAGGALGEADVIFRHGGAVLLAEVSKTRDAPADKKVAFFARWRDPTVRRLLWREVPEVLGAPISTAYFDLAKESAADESPAVLAVAGNMGGCHLAYRDYARFGGRPGPEARERFLEGTAARPWRDGGGPGEWGRVAAALGGGADPGEVARAALGAAPPGTPEAEAAEDAYVLAGDLRSAAGGSGPAAAGGIGPLFELAALYARARAGGRTSVRRATFLRDVARLGSGGADLRRLGAAAVAARLAEEVPNSYRRLGAAGGAGRRPG